MNGNQPANPQPESAFAFSGSHVRSVDVKGRFNLPFKFLRGGSGLEEEEFVIIKSTGGYLNLMPKSVWTANANRLRHKYLGQKLRDYVRKMNSACLTVTPDSQGRIAVGKEKLMAMGIDKKVEIVGIGDRMELWDPAALVTANAVEDDYTEFDDEFFR